MFKFKFEEKQQNIFKKMEKLPQLFFLTGSRYFGHHSPSSDWDFFTDRNTNLRDVGFFKLEFASYSDQNITEVFRYTEDNLQVDVQIVPDLESKIHCQKALFALFGANIKNIGKNERNILWDAMYWAIKKRTQFSMDRGYQIVLYPNTESAIKEFL